MIDPNELFDVVHQGTVLFEASLNEEGRLAREQRRSRVEDASPIVYSATQAEDAVYEFELESAAEALETLAAEIDAEVARRQAEIYAKSVEVYYVMEELSRDPEHAHLIPQLAVLQAAHQRSYGKPIPPRAAKS